MTPTPSAGDIWEWLYEPHGLFLLIQSNGDPYDWYAMNLTSGKADDISFHAANAHNWRLLA